MIERIQPTEAFALRRYINSDGNFNFQGLARDATSLAREADVDKPIEKRVVRTVEAFWGNNVVQGRVDKRKDVSEYFSYDTELQRAESLVGEGYREGVLSWHDGEIGIWLSPPGDGQDDYEGAQNYKEGRLRIAIKRVVSGIHLIETYTITLVGVTPEQCLKQFNELGNEKVKKPRDLRSLIIRVPVSDSSKDWTTFLEDKIDLSLVPSEVWKDIRSGEIARDSRKMFHQFKSAIITPEIEKCIQEAVNSGNHRQLIDIGAQIEGNIVKLGHNITAGVCGILNLDIVGNRVSSYNPLDPDKFLISEKILKCVKCPNPPDGCGQTVDAKVCSGTIECLSCGATAPWN